MHNVVEASVNTAFDLVRDHDTHFEAYRRVNFAMATALAGLLSKQDLVWIHGYELMLLPKLMVDVYVVTPGSCKLCVSSSPRADSCLR